MASFGRHSPFCVAAILLCAAPHTLRAEPAPDATPVRSADDTDTAAAAEGDADFDASVDDDPYAALYDDELSAEEWAVVEAAQAYVVEAEAPRVPEPGVEVAIESGPYAPDVAKVIDAAPGARALRSGGPLARSELRVRGLGGPRLSIRLDGIPLDDPAGGTVDLSELEGAPLQEGRLLRGPETGGLAPGALAGVLDLRSAMPSPGLHARLQSSIGTEQTSTVRSRLSYRVDRGHLGLSVFAGRSQGDFIFRPVSYSGDSVYIGEPTQRHNNDQARYGATLQANLRGEQLAAAGLVHVTQHEGGVAGLAGHPTPQATQQASSVLAGGHGELVLESLRLVMSLSGRARDDVYRNPDALTPVASSQRTVATALELMLASAVLKQLAAELGAEAKYARTDPLSGAPLGAASQAGLSADRGALAALGRARLTLLDSRLAVNASLRVDALSDVGVEPSWATRIAVAVTPALLLEAHAGRAFRPATFVEKYGPPVGYVRANPDLLPEDGVELGLDARYSRSGVSAELSLFGARLRSAILYLNRNAYEVRPENTGDVWRGGGELWGWLQPLPWLRHGAGLEVVVSHVDVTGAPLPTTPLLRLHSRSELSLQLPWQHWRLGAFVDGRAQSAAASNVYGELTVPAQAALDLGAALQLTEHSALSFEARNLLDVQTRVDLHQIPLPGRQLLLTLTVGV